MVCLFYRPIKSFVFIPFSSYFSWVQCKHRFGIFFPLERLERLLECYTVRVLILKGMNKYNWLTWLKSGSQMNKFVNSFFPAVFRGNLVCPKCLIEWASILDTNQGTTRTYIFITLAKTIFFCREIFAIRLLHQEACSCLCFTVSHAAMSWKFRKTIFPTVEFDRFDVRINNSK